MFWSRARWKGIPKTCSPLCFRIGERDINLRKHALLQFSSLYEVNNRGSFGLDKDRDYSVFLMCCSAWPSLGQSENNLKFSGLEPLLTSKKSDSILIKEMEPPGKVLAEFMWVIAISTFPGMWFYWLKIPKMEKQSEIS